MPRTLVSRRLAGVATVSTAILLLGLPLAAPAGQDVRAVVCPALDRAPREVAALVEPLGDAGRTALLALASSTAADAACGIAGLAAVRDPRVVPLLVGAIQRAPADADVWRLVRWASFVAGGPDPNLGAPLQALLATFATPAARAAAGDDWPRLLGELALPVARDALVEELERPLDASAVDAVVHALARQREPRPQSRVAALGAEVISELAGNATYEQARRLGAAAFYLLALGPDTRAEGMRLMTRLAPQDQADTAAWAAQTLCEQAVRRPETAADALALRHALGETFAAAGVRWEPLVRGAFPCPPAP